MICLSEAYHNPSLLLSLLLLILLLRCVSVLHRAASWLPADADDADADVITSSQHPSIPGTAAPPFPLFFRLTDWRTD